MKPFSNLIRHKKTIALLLLFFIVSGIVIPQTASAGAITGAVTGGAIGCAAGVGIGLLAAPWTGGFSIGLAIGTCTTLASTGAWIGGAIGLTKEADAFEKAIIIALGEGLYTIVDGIASYAVNLLATFLTVEFINKPITTQAGFSKGWAQVRDLANMFVVLGFVFVGIAFTLRIEGYGTKKVLISLILVAILINFSGLLSGLIIDASNKITVHFLTANTGELPSSQLGIKLLYAIEKAHDIYPFDEAKSVTGILMGVMGFVVSIVLIAITFFYLSIIMYARAAIFGIFFVLSPLAFLCWVFPATKKLWSMWWENFIKWALIGAQVAFFVWVASLILEGTKKSLWGTGLFPHYELGHTELIAIVVLLYVAVTVAKKSSAIGAGAVIGLAAGAAGAVWGAGKFLGKGTLKQAADRTGLTRAGYGAKDMATAGLERVGLIKQGTTAANKAKRLEESKKRLENITDNEQLAKIAESRPLSHREAVDKAVAAKILAERKAFDKVDPMKREAVAAHAAAFGVSKDTFTKERPETFAAGTDKEAIKKIRSDRAVDMMNTYGMTADEAWAGAKTYNPTDNEIDAAKIGMRNQRLTENALSVTPVTDKDVHNKLLENRQKDIIAVARAAGSDILPEDAMKLAAANFKPSEGEIATTKTSLSQERIQKAIGKLDRGKIPELPKEVLSNREFGKSVGYRALSGALPRLSKDKLDEVKKLIPELIDEKNLVAPPPPSYTGTADQWKDLSAAQRSSAWSMLTPAQRATARAGWSDDVKKQVRELNNKIKSISLA